VFVISPYSVASEECKQELSCAAELNKGIIPLNLRLTPFADLPETLKAVQFVPPRGRFENDPDPSSDNTFENSLPLLITTIDTDLDATREHTEWGKKALEWEKHARDRSFSLYGSPNEVRRLIFCSTIGVSRSGTADEAVSHNWAHLGGQG
jgi:hypothetical protein